MPDVTIGIYKLILTGAYLGETFQNVFHYQSVPLTSGLESSLATAFDNSVMPSIAPIISASAGFTSIEVEELGSINKPIVITPTLSNGSLAGVPQPGSLCSSLKIVGQTRETRDGFKRFVGVTEEVVDSNDFTAAFDTLLANLAGVLAGTLINGLDTFALVIYGGPIRDDLTRSVYNPISGVVPLVRVRTQVSRRSPPL